MSGPRKIPGRWPRSAAHLCDLIDSRVAVPRPADAQHLTSRQAISALLGAAGAAMVTIGCGLISAFVWWKIVGWLEPGPEWAAAFLALALACLLVSLAEAASLMTPYLPGLQRSTHGTSRWADGRILADLGLARGTRDPVRAGELPLGILGRRHRLVLGAEQAMCHVAMFGPPGSGKSATFITSWLRAWAAAGSAVVLDPKGELYGRTARCFADVYRVDLHDPRRSDVWNFVPACRHDAELAHEVASIILGVDADRPTRADPFWREAETAALTAVLLYLAKDGGGPSPASVQELVSRHSLEDLNRMMMGAPDPRVPLHWGMFTKVEPKLQGSVLIGLTVKCAPFATPNVRAVTSPRAGAREIDFAALRRPRTALYVVVPEGDAVRYKVVVATLFGLATSRLRKGELTDASAPVLFCFDEAGTIPVHGLGELVGVGRGRRTAVALGYQNLAQVYRQYGADGGDAVLGSIGTLVFLPGLDQRTAEYASRRIGQATVWQTSAEDVRGGRKHDSERSSEAGRPLIDPSEVRCLLKYRQAVAVIATAPPVKFSFPSFDTSGGRPPRGVVIADDRPVEAGDDGRKDVVQDNPPDGIEGEWQKKRPGGATAARQTAGDGGPAAPMVFEVRPIGSPGEGPAEQSGPGFEDFGIDDLNGDWDWEDQE